jgi:hypothetical protein
MFQFPGLPPTGLCVHPGVARLATVRGSPIRRSSAPSPRAAPRGISLLRHVLLRHERPRHPPDALRHGHTGAGSPPSPLPRDPLIFSLLLLSLTHARQRPTRRQRASHTATRLRSSPVKVLRSRPRLLPDSCQAASDNDIERGVVEMRRLELLTPSVQRRCSPN